MKGSLSKKDLIEIWQFYTGVQNIEEIDDNEEDEEEETYTLFYNTYEYQGAEEGNKETVEKFKEEINGIKDRKGIGCIIQLIKKIDHWCFETCLTLGLYKNTTSNLSEGFFGSLKLRLKRRKVMLKELIDVIKEMCSDEFKNHYTIELPREIIDINDIRYRQLTPLSKIIIMEQVNLANSDHYKSNNSKCLSCKIRNSNLINFWPCCHLFKELYGNSIFIKYEDLPARCFSKQSQSIKSTDSSICNLIKPEKSSTLNKITYMKVYKNTPSIPRRNVEMRRKRVKQIIHNTYGFNDFRSMINHSYLNGITLINGFLSSTEIDISVVNSLEKNCDNVNDKELIESIIDHVDENVEEININDSGDEIDIYTKEVIELFSIQLILCILYTQQIEFCPSL